MFNAKMQPYVSIKQTRSAAMADLLPCDSAAIRTQDLLLRRQLLYPAELRNLRVLCRDSLIRTGDLLLPKQAR